MRNLTNTEIASLKARGCSSDSWDNVLVADAFTTDYVANTSFSGQVTLGVFEKFFELPGGVYRHSGLFNVTLHNVIVGDNCYLSDIHNYIANYDIGEDSFIENVDLLLVDGPSAFGNGTGVSVLNETGGREVIIFDNLSAQTAYLMAFYRYKPSLIAAIEKMIADYSRQVLSSKGRIGNNALIMNTGSIRNVRIGECCRINGARLLENGSINSNKSAPVRIGGGVTCNDFIISSGSSLNEGVVLSKCFVGQACQLGRTYSASDSVFFSNCVGQNGEACSIFAGPYTVTHHKSTLLIAGMFSFMNAGSGSNQSNHMYKLGPIHQGILERGAKTSSDSYVLWPARVGPFSLVMGRHVNHSDTTNLPFSYLIEQGNTTYLVPGVNLRSCGTIRDARKWPVRDNRTDTAKLDYVNCNILSPFTIQKMFKGREILFRLRQASGELSDIYSFHSAKIRNSSLAKGLEYYRIGISKFLGNSIISRLEKSDFINEAQMRSSLKPTTDVGKGEWADIAGLIAPNSEIESIMSKLVSGEIQDFKALDVEFFRLDKNYYEYEWTWAYDRLQEFYGFDPREATVEDIESVVKQWKEDVVNLDRMIYEDSRKEFSLASKTGFGADGSRKDKEYDFEQVRGSFEENPFVKTVLTHIRVKSELGDSILARLSSLKR